MLADPGAKVDSGTVGDAQAVEIYRSLIVSGAKTADQYVANRIANSPGAHIGPSYAIGIDERETRELLEGLLRSIELHDFDRSLSRYFDALRNYCGSSYQALSSRFPEGITLEEVYVPLRAADGQGTGETCVLANAVRSALDSGSNHILVEGAPGSGKSTLLRQIARHAWDDPGSVGLNRRYIALPLRLRSYAQVAASGREDRIWQALDRARDLELDGSRPPAGFYEAWSKQMDAPWLFLLDGFDEVPEELREETVASLRRLARDGATFVMTSRPSADLPDALLRQVKRLEIQPFSAAEQRELVKKWLGTQADAFQAAFTRFADGELGGTPLLLTIAVIVFHQTGKLPSRRSELYRDFVEDTWKEALKRGALEELGAELFELAPVLVPLCLEYIARSTTETRGQGASLDFGSGFESLARSIAELLAAKLQLTETVASFRAQRLVRFLGTRSGVLRIFSHQCEWLHPTFREFLAAKAIAEQASESELQEVLARFDDAAWRQVALFVLSIRSERRSVVADLKRIKVSKPPFGAAFVATAISEGAAADKTLTAEVVSELCDDILENSKTGTCQRLLTPGDGGRQTRMALIPFMQKPELSEITGKLKERLAHLACSYGVEGSSAVSDLQELGAHDELLHIAQDSGAPPLVRADAAFALYSVGRTESARTAFCQLFQEVDREFEGWPRLLRLLARTASADLFVDMVERRLLEGERWGSLLDALHDGSKLQVMAALAGERRLSTDQRLAVDLRNIPDGERILQLLPSLPDRTETLKPYFDMLVGRSDRSALLRIATGTEWSRAARLLALRGLKTLKAHDELRQIVVRADLPYGLRRRATEILYHSQLDSDLATTLLEFFVSIPNSAERLSILPNCAFLNYVLGRYEEAKAAFDKVYSRRAGTSWEQSIVAHCLESLGRKEEALKAYGASVELNPLNYFSRCRRACLLWRLERFAEALTDVGEMKADAIPDWFLPYGGDILREAGRLDEAEELLDRAVEQDPTSAMALAFRACAAFDRGRLADAVADLRQAVELNPGYGYAKRQLAKTLRVAEMWDEAVDAYDALLRDAPESLEHPSQIAVVRLRQGRFADADRIIADYRLRVPKEPFFAYLEALSREMQGDRKASRGAVGKALELMAVDGDNSQMARSNRALALFMLEESAEAQAIIEDLLRERAFDELRYYTSPYLEDLRRAFPERSDIVGAASDLRTKLWPDGFGSDLGPGAGPAILRRVKRGRHPFPMYCQLQVVAGLEQDRALGTAVLDLHNDAERSIVLWTMGRDDHLYGQCNFKKDKTADYDLKFCDEVDLILAQNLPILVRDFGVRRLIFLEDALLRRFRDEVAANGLDANCVLVQPPPRFKLPR